MCTERKTKRREEHRWPDNTFLEHETCVDTGGMTRIVLPAKVVEARGPARVRGQGGSD